jgi:Ca-activated chloride channel family protein
MPESGFHFAHPLWLWGLFVPLPVWVWSRLTATRQNLNAYRAYADAHLLPFLSGVRPSSPALLRRRFLAWSAAWTLIVLAAAGPRWDYTDVQLFRPGIDVVVLLDLSRSMDATDVAPSRLGRARQEVEDLLRAEAGVRVGLIGFATVAHVISPLTEDASGLQHQLPALSTDLVQLKGSRVTEALLRARQILAGQPKESTRHVLLVSDGDFGDEGFVELAGQLAAEDIRVHVLGVGTTEGSPVPAAGGEPLRHPRHGTVISALDEARLAEIARAGNGIYRTAVYGGEDTGALLDVLAERGSAEALADQRTRIWHERYDWLVLVLMALLLPRFRRSLRRARA